MKKILLICASVLLISACSEKEEFEQAVLTQMETEQDLKDYKIDPAHMTECVVELSSKKMPGLFPLDPVKLTAYKNYAQMLSMSTTEDKQKKLEELRSLFGSPRDLAKAHANYTESVMNCLSSIVMKTGDAEMEKIEKEEK